MAPESTNSEWGTSSFSYPDINIEHRTQTVFHNLEKLTEYSELERDSQNYKNHKEIINEENMSQTLPLDGLPPVSTKFIFPKIYNWLLV